MSSTTSTNSGNWTSDGSSLFSKLVYVTDVCKCGKEYDAAYLSKFSHHKARGVIATKCEECAEIERERIQEQKYALEREVNRWSVLRSRFERKSLMNPKLKMATFHNYEQSTEELNKAKAITERYAKNFDLKNPVSLLLIGNYGTGKSHLSVAICKKVIELFHEAYFISTPKLLTQLRSTYNKDSEVTEQEIIEKLSRVDLLVLDDIGSEQTKTNHDENNQTWATSKLFEIIDNRIGKHTIFTTNFEPKELQQRLGGRNFSRMMEGTHVVKMYGDDYRLRNFK